MTLEIVLNILLVIGGVVFPLATGPPIFGFGTGSAKRRLIQLMIQSFQNIGNIIEINGQKLRIKEII